MGLKFGILEFQGPYGPPKNSSPCGELARFAHIPSRFARALIHDGNKETTREDGETNRWDEETHPRGMTEKRTARGGPEQLTAGGDGETHSRGGRRNAQKK